jgi:hypothetical protein
MKTNSNFLIMKRVFLFVVISLGIVFSAKTQVGINSNNSLPNLSAGLDVDFNDKGFLMPRMTEQQIISIINPAVGLMVFCSDKKKVFIYVGESGQWKELQYGKESIGTPFSCGTSITKVHSAGVVAPVDKTVVYQTINNIPGEPSKCWITKNLGATIQATSNNDTTEAAAGWYWQFNRKQGFRHNGAYLTPSGQFVFNINEVEDWTFMNDPCSIEFGGLWRIPTLTEWENVTNSGNWINGSSTWNSNLKIHQAGWLDYSDGSLRNRGTIGTYYSNRQQTQENAYRIYITNQSITINGHKKSNGYTIRCVR